MTQTLKDYKYQQALTLWLYCGIIADGYTLDSDHTLTEITQDV